MRSELPGRPAELVISDIDLMEPDATTVSRLGQIVQVTGGQIINDQNIPTLIHQPPDEMRTDEPCAAGNEGPAVQRRRLLAGTKRYLTKAHNAGNPSCQEIFFPSSISLPAYRIGTS